METIKIVDCYKVPEAVGNQIRDYWRTLELGNDYYYYRTNIYGLLETEDDAPDTEVWEDLVFGDNGRKISGGWVTTKLKVDEIIKYLREQGLGDDEDVLLHYWW